MTREDTIAAVATPPGQGGVGIVRVSGPAAAEIARQVLGEVPAARHAALCAFRDEKGEPIDTGIALYFSAPNSFTGEDVLELQGHGGPVVMDLLLRRVVGLGARLAEPGEFSLRAFLNDKVDLAQAEAIADLIAAGSEQAARAAMHSLQGEFSTRVHALVESLIGLRTYIEAAIDFPEEEIDFLSDGAVAARLADVHEQLVSLEASATQGRLLRDGMTVVIAGHPNAGKSSLLNALAGYDAAIVTDIPGTTRDVLRERINIDGMPLHIVDTAGLREHSDDPVEQEGMRRARAEIGQADEVLIVIDEADGAGSPDPERLRQLITALPDDLLHEDRPPPTTIVSNKIDLTGEDARIVEEEYGARVWISALTGAGLDLLRDHLKRRMGFQMADGGTIIARRRHLEALRGARANFEEARLQLEESRAGELVAEELRLAQVFLAGITGEFTGEDLLGEIFSSFCIGK